MSGPLSANGMPVELDAQQMPPMLLAGMTTAVVAGLTGSLHCGLMCGPLACASVGGTSRGVTALAWQAGRLLGYTVVGALLGALSQTLSLMLTFSVLPYLPYLMAAGLIVTALDLGRHLSPLPGVGRISKVLARAGQRRSPEVRAFALGAATPFLPCGLLYGLFLAALAMNSAIGGGLVMAAFALGAMPLLLAVQLGVGRLNRWPAAALVMKRVVPLVAAAVLIARAVIARSAGPDCH